MNKLSNTNILKLYRSNVLIGSTYQHYKGSLYQIKDIVLYEKTVKPLIIYQDKSNLDLIWARDFDDFFCNVTIDNHEIPRFKLV